MSELCTQKIFRVESASFIGDDGIEVTGKYVYLIPSSGQGQPVRKFFSNQVLSGLSYAPCEGDVVYLFDNGYGRIVDILKV